MVFIFFLRGAADFTDFHICVSIQRWSEKSPSNTEMKHSWCRAHAERLRRLPFWECAVMSLH